MMLGDSGCLSRFRVLCNMVDLVLQRAQPLRMQYTCTSNPNKRDGVKELHCVSAVSSDIRNQRRVHIFLMSYLSD